MAIEGFKNGSKEAVSHEHAGGCNVDDRDPFLGRDGFERILALRGAGRDASPVAVWITGIQDVDRNVLLDRGQQGCGMQDFGSEVGEFGGFVKADDLDTAGVGTNVRIGSHHAVNVGPYLDALGTETCPHNGGGEIRSASADGGRGSSTG